MTTQSLRGMANHGPMHWRGDRNGAVQQNGAAVHRSGDESPVVSAQPNNGHLRRGQGVRVVQRRVPRPARPRRAARGRRHAGVHDFILDMTYPPNPIRNLDNSLTAEQQAGPRLLLPARTSNGAELPSTASTTATAATCSIPTATRVAPTTRASSARDGRLSFENLPQMFKVPHLRNVYQKVGMFASSPDSNRTAHPDCRASIRRCRRCAASAISRTAPSGSIVHHLTPGLAGASSTTTGRTRAAFRPFTFDANGNPTGIDSAGFPMRHAIASFVLAYDSNMKPIVGQQLTLTAANAGRRGHERPHRVARGARRGR